MERDTAQGAWKTITIAFDATGQIVNLTLNRPEAVNALSRDLAADLSGACAWLSDQPAVRVVVLAGAGVRGFCAGADLKERRALSAELRTRHTAAVEAAAEAIAALPMPTVASLHGYTLAGGAELALACDVRIAATDTILGFPEVRIGIFPGAGGVLRLPRLVGSGAARDLLFTGRRVDAEEAFRLGLVDRLAPPEGREETVTAYAALIAGNAPLATRAVKQALLESEGAPTHQGRTAVNARRAALDQTADYEEGLAAFAARREPRFSGC